MPRSLEAIARDLAERAVHEAERAGYGLAGTRATFFRSDLMKLEGEILIWLQEHMVPEPADAD